MLIWVYDECYEKSGDVVTIDFLCRYPQYTDSVAGWIYSTFVVNSPRTATLDKIIQNLKKASETEFPITFVAIENRECIGTVSIFSNDLKTQSDLTPWLAAVIVRPEFRNRGVAAALIKHACGVAKSLGFSTIYLRTEHAAQYYERLGWEFICSAVDENGIETAVYKLSLL